MEVCFNVLYMHFIGVECRSHSYLQKFLTQHRAFGKEARKKGSTATIFRKKFFTGKCFKTKHEQLLEKTMTSIQI